MWNSTLGGGEVILKEFSKTLEKKAHCEVKGKKNNHYQQAVALQVHAKLIQSLTAAENLVGKSRIDYLY